MSYDILIYRKGYKQALRVIADTFKNRKVWKVRFQDGEEALLFKCGNEWLHRNEDDLDRGLLKAIGEKIDRILLGVALS